METRITFRQISAFAMQYGAFLGLWGLATGAFFVASFSRPMFSSLFLTFMLFSPFLGLWVTFRFRRHVAPDVFFPFSTAFLHTFLSWLYASLWVALGTYIYMAYFDHGYVFDAYLENLKRPELQQQMQETGLTQQIAQMTGGETPESMIEALRSIPPANFSALVLYVNILFAPFLSLLAGLVCQRRWRYRA